MERIKPHFKTMNYFKARELKKPTKKHLGFSLLVTRFLIYTENEALIVNAEKPFVF